MGDIFPGWTLSWFSVYKGQMEGGNSKQALEEAGCRDSEMMENDKQKGSEDGWIGIG